MTAAAEAAAIDRHVGRVLVEVIAAAAEGPDRVAGHRKVAGPVAIARAEIGQVAVVRAKDDLPIVAATDDSGRTPLGSRVRLRQR